MTPLLGFGSKYGPWLLYTNNTQSLNGVRQNLLSITVPERLDSPMVENMRKVHAILFNELFAHVVTPA